MIALFVAVYLPLFSWEGEAIDKVHGVNYGGRFIPEYFMKLPGTKNIIFKDTNKRDGAHEISLCDVFAADKQDRMSQFLDTNIKEEHFHTMSSLGFNLVRLPLGYWNLIDLAPGATPSGPWRDRWQNLQNMQPSAKSYMKWIDQVFQYAAAAGLQVLLDFHSAPGGQSGNQNCGCDLTNPILKIPSTPIPGVDLTGVYQPGFFDNDWNHNLSIQAIERMAMICADKGSVCWGIELLNEPYGPLPESIGPLPNNGLLAGALGKLMLSRDSLLGFYLKAIKAARKFIAQDVPIVIMDWSYWLKNYWKQRANAFFSDKGRILFSTHYYPGKKTIDLESAKQIYYEDFEAVHDFTSSTGFDLLVTEYALSNHGSGEASDHFLYANMTRWLVKKMDSYAGGIVWNFDSKYNSWGPVKNAASLGVPWGEIYGIHPKPWYYGGFTIICIGACICAICFGFAWLRKNISKDEGFSLGSQPGQGASATLVVADVRTKTNDGSQEEQEALTGFRPTDNLSEPGFGS